MFDAVLMEVVLPQQYPDSVTTLRIYLDGILDTVRVVAPGELRTHRFVASVAAAIRVEACEKREQAEVFYSTVSPNAILRTPLPPNTIPLVLQSVGPLFAPAAFAVGLPKPLGVTDAPSTV